MRLLNLKLLPVICAVRDLIETIFVHRSVACAILGLFTC